MPSQTTIIADYISPLKPRTNNCTLNMDNTTGADSPIDEDLFEFPFGEPCNNGLCFGRNPEFDQNSVGLQCLSQQANLISQQTNSPQMSPGYWEGWVGWDCETGNEDSSQNPETVNLGIAAKSPEQSNKKQARKDVKEQEQVASLADEWHDLNNQLLEKIRQCAQNSQQRQKKSQDLEANIQANSQPNCQAKANSQLSQPPADSQLKRPKPARNMSAKPKEPKPKGEIQPAKGKSEEEVAALENSKLVELARGCPGITNTKLLGFLLDRPNPVPYKRTKENGRNGHRSGVSRNAADKIVRIIQNHANHAAYEELSKFLQLLFANKIQEMQNRSYSRRIHQWLDAQLDSNISTNRNVTQEFQALHKAMSECSSHKASSAEQMQRLLWCYVFSLVLGDWHDQENEHVQENEQVQLNNEICLMVRHLYYAKTAELTRADAEENAARNAAKKRKTSE